ncbi:MAG: outer membrane beta-barrel protein, partial [Chitinophagales bacterium]
PVVDLSNPNMIYKGNENLVNEYNHNLFFHYMKPNIVKGTFFIVVSNISYTNNRIANFTYSAINDTAIDGVQLRRGVQYAKNVNMDNAFSSFLFGNYTMPIKPLKSNFTLNGNFSYNQNPSMVNFTEAMTKTYMYSIGTMLASSTMENIDYSLSYNPKYFNNTFDLPNVSDNNYWIHTAAANAKFTIAKNIMWSTDFTYNFNSQIDPSLNQHIFLLGSSLAYKLLKNRNLEAKITVFDILGQNQNISRTVNNTNITDNRTNALQRYGLFTLTYSLKKVQGRDPEKNNTGFFNMMKPKDD